MKTDIQVVPISAGQLPALRAAAAADGDHAVIHPTHRVDRAGELVGYASLGRVRLFFAWLDSQKLSAPESFSAWRQAEAILRQQNAGPIALACGPDSPLKPFVTKMGYRFAGDCGLYLKDF